MSDMDQFDRICGNCAGVDILSVTAADVRNQAAVWGNCTEEEIQAAIRGLEEYQTTEREITQSVEE